MGLRQSYGTSKKETKRSGLHLGGNRSEVIQRMRHTWGGGAIPGKKEGGTLQKQRATLDYRRQRNKDLIRFTVTRKWNLFWDRTFAGHGVTRL